MMQMKLLLSFVVWVLDLTNLEMQPGFRGVTGRDKYS
jgi:hypothetical protein